jgi:hypothetical protein
MLFFKNKSSRSSRVRSRGKRTSKKNNMMRGGFQAYVKLPPGNGHGMINIEPDDTIAKVKDMIKKTMFRASFQWDIVFNDRVLDDDRTVAYYNIKKDSQLQIIERQPGLIAEWLGDQFREALREHDYQLATKRAADRATNQAANQAANQPANQTANQHTNQPANRR